MTSAAKAAASAANSRLSTGPRTEEGKAASSRNALKHGLTAKDLVVREDEREEFESLKSDLDAELAPEGVLETITFNQILHAAWNIQRFRRLESWLMSGDVDPVLDDSAAKTLDRLYRYVRTAERTYDRAIKQLQALRTNRALKAVKLNEEEQALVPQLVSVNDLLKRNNAEVTAKALDMATQMLDYEAKTLSMGSFRKNGDRADTIKH
jgi:hypothetical protein